MRRVEKAKPAPVGRGREMTVEDRVHTGIDGLDSMLEGGFPRGSLIILAGNTGTGKTIFSSQFLIRGAAEYGEKGIYASFSESKRTLTENISRQLGLKAADWNDDACRVLDLATMREAGISDIMTMILSNIQEMGAKRLVIDSFSAIAQAFKERIDARIVLHTILGKITRELGCTTILIVEIPIGEETIGMGMEEFVADGVLILRRKELEGRLFRELEIEKMRGTEVRRQKCIFTLHKGFNCFSPSQWVELPLEKRRIVPVYADRTPETISTCIEELDQLLNGGWKKGSFNLLEIGEGVGRGYAGMTVPMVLSSVNMGRSAYVVPVGGASSTHLSREWSKQCVEGSEERLKISMDVDDVPKDRSDYIFETNRTRPEAFERYLKLRQQLKKKSKDNILIELIGTDTLEYDYGADRLASQLNVAARLAREAEDVHVYILKEGQAVSRAIAHLVDTHWKFKMLHGALLFYGILPETGLYVMESDVSKGYTKSTITPIV